MKNIFIVILALFIVIHQPAAANAAAKKPLQSKTIAVDPGHGGYDPGAVWGNIYEKDINLKISKILSKYLQDAGAKVILTRDGDYNHAIVGLHGRDAKRYDLNRRIKLIESHKADLVITIHVNSLRQKSYEGAETFYHPKSKEGKLLALAIQQELRTIPGMKKRIAKISNCYMLSNTKVPAVLVEAGFLSNPHERKLLQYPEYLDVLAQKIAAGVVKYYTSPAEVENQGVLQKTSAGIDFIFRVMEHAFLAGDDFKNGHCDCIIH
ncbi:N-acetylmuramoyl-L-alanine amidase [Desulfallas sp. Bu1-1]|jgi:N-acetylmuramoyl-L-alanine amidase|uniref:N-acetylmuramoyl-L-alanine amidase family protein n=1 Tax=Desulfallas sp. Bu1-1 TaxID=2787620 RepID=UPI00189E6B48|nr:N-acetylmuramoyl-L-alanine amidase [Desulfallas sp. Bu1-1]MBF7082886.1 N-acetylmuramoyl-L-alanine amidase [Desulfallas sp. Bu1-1]